MIKMIMIGAGILLCLSACHKGGDVHLGEDTSEGFSSIDTTTVQASTVLLDSLKSSGTGTIMLGRLNDPELGVIEASSYLPLAIPDSPYPDLANSPTARFDSVTLKLAYSESYYGDTTQLNCFEIHRLSEKLKLKDNPQYNDADEQSLITNTSGLYNNSVTKYENVLLGNKSYRPRPKGIDSITIKLSDSFGAMLYNLIKTKDPSVSTQEKFLNFFKGIALVPGTSTGNNIIHFLANHTSMQIYYSEASNQGIREVKSIVFNLSDASLQYNRITADRSNTIIEPLGGSKKELPYIATNNRCFIQAGIGLVTKVKFPYILQWLSEPVNAINQATLTIEIPKGSNDIFDLPPNLNLFIANKKNQPQKVMNNFYASGDQNATIQKDYDNDIKGNIRYVFNITEFLNNFRKTPGNTDLSLLISVPLSRLSTSVERAVTGAPGNSQAKIKLNILYTKYQIPLPD